MKNRTPSPYAPFHLFTALIRYCTRTTFLCPPHAVVDGAVSVEVHELVGHGDVMEGALLLVPEEGVGHPDHGHQLGVQLEPLRLGEVGEPQARVHPPLSQVHVQRVVLCRQQELERVILQVRSFVSDGYHGGRSRSLTECDETIN